MPKNIYLNPSQILEVGFYLQVGIYSKPYPYLLQNKEIRVHESSLELDEEAIFLLNEKSILKASELMKQNKWNSELGEVRDLKLKGGIAKTFYRPGSSIIGAMIQAAVLIPMVEFYATLFPKSKKGEQYSTLSELDLADLQIMLMFIEVGRTIEKKGRRSYAALEYLHYFEANAFTRNKRELYTNALAIEFMECNSEDLKGIKALLHHKTENKSLHSSILKQIDSETLISISYDKLETFISLLAEVNQLYRSLLTFRIYNMNQFVDSLLKKIQVNNEFEKSKKATLKYLELLNYISILFEETGLIQAPLIMLPPDYEMMVKETDEANLREKVLTFIHPQTLYGNKIFQFCTIITDDKNKSRSVILSLFDKVESIPKPDFSLPLLYEYQKRVNITEGNVQNIPMVEFMPIKRPLNIKKQDTNFK